MKKKWLTAERVSSIVGFIFLMISFAGSLFMLGDKQSIFEFIPGIPEGIIITRYILPIVHLCCALTCLYIVFKPSLKIQVGLFLTESIITILTNYEQLGIFLFHAALILILINDDFSFRSKKKVIFLFIIHFLSIFGIVTHGWPRVFIALGTTCFYYAFFTWIFKILKTKFSCFLPNILISNSVIKEKAGETLSLSSYGLSERQIKITIDYIQNKTSYKALSEKYITSLSSIKKDFSIIFKKFEVANLNELSFLLVQYSLVP